MNTTIEQYVNNQLNRNPYLVNSLIQDANGNKYIPRNAILNLKKYISDFQAGQREIRIICIPGLRGVGKTTLLAQLYDELFLKQKTHMLYLSADQIVNLLRADLNTTLEAYENVLGKSLEKLDKNTFIFIDEIQADKNWSHVLKSIYDRSKNIFLVCTGSSALSLQSSSDLARRIIYEKLYPLKFEEYILLKYRNKHPIKGLKEAIREALINSNDGKDCFEKLKNLKDKVKDYWIGIERMEIDNYLRFGTMPFTLQIEDENKSTILMNELIDRVVNRDLFDLGKFTTDTIDKVKSILFMVASSQETSITGLSQNLSNISVNTLLELFSALEKAELLIRVYPYGTVFKKIRKPSKYFFMSPALRHSLLNVIEGSTTFSKNKGKYLEDLAAFYFLPETWISPSLNSICYDSSKGGADFIVRSGEKKIAIEVGIGKKIFSQAAQTLKKIDGTYGLVISDGVLEFLSQENIVKVPLQYFLLI